MPHNETVVCILQVAARNCIQEWYESATFDAARRARQLRKAGIKCSVSAMGMQVTELGRIKLSMVSTLGWDDPLAEGHEHPPTVEDLPAENWRLERSL